MSTPAALSIAALAHRIAATARSLGGPIVLQGGPGEPVALRDCWRDEPDLLEGLSLCALFLPGVNRTDYTRLAPGVSMALFLATPDYAEAIAAGRATVAPVHYSAIPDAISARAPSVAVLHVAPPDADGQCSLGVCADIGLSAARAAKHVVGVVNHAMPSIKDAPHWPFAHFDAVATVNHPLAELAHAAPSGAAAIAAHVNALVEDGDCIQIGIGKLPSAILASLHGKLSLRFHGGLIGPGHLALANAGCVRDEPGALTGGVALGDAAFYAALSGDRRVRMAPIGQTHGLARLGAITRFTAINAALEIDLFGQTNAEWAGDRWIAGIGGLGDFVRAARASAGGRAIIAVQATGADGASRIKARLDSPTCTLARADADIFVSEYGVACVRNLSAPDRAVAIANLAAPAHRDGLLAQWRRA